MTVDAQAPQQFTLLKSETHDLVVHAPDGLPTHTLVTADGKTLIDETTTKQCNVPKAWAKFNCPTPGSQSPPTISYWFGNNSDVPAVFSVHQNDGKVVTQTHFSLHNITIGWWEAVAEGEHYHGYVTIDGVTAASVEGVVDCVPDPTPPTTGPPTVPPTTTPTTSTSTTVVSQVAPADPPTTTTTVTATLPFTGGSSIPLGLSGLGLVIVGSALLALRRRKPVE